MKKLVSIFAILLFGVVSVSAQNAFIGGHRAWTVAVQGGPLYSINENHFSYRDNGYGAKLFTLQGSAAIGYEFTNALGVRLSVGYGANRGAGNTKETSAHGFYPYNFRSLNAFLDFTLDLNGNYAVESAFRPIFYLGVGNGYTFGFSKPENYGSQRDFTWEPNNPFHPWQDITTFNSVFGFRGGFIAEYDFTQNFGIFADLCGEAYLDQYNGLQPTARDQSDFAGYAGFPFDIRFMASFGVIFRFNN